MEDLFREMSLDGRTGEKNSSDLRGQKKNDSKKRIGEATLTFGQEGYLLVEETIADQCQTHD